MEEILKMQPTTEILARISRNSLANKYKIFTRLYRYLLRPDPYFQAYKNLYANNRAAKRVQMKIWQMDSARLKLRRSFKRLLMKPTNLCLLEELISRKRIIRRRSVLWEFQHSQTSWSRKFFEWSLKQYMNLSFCRFPVG